MKRILPFVFFFLTTLFASSLQSFAQCTGANMGNPIVVGTIGAGSAYSNTQYNGNSCFGNDYGQPSYDIYYRFTLTSSLQVNISLCGSGFDTYLWLLDANGNQIAYNDDYGPLCSTNESSISQTLGAGTYYVVSEGYSSNSGNLVTQISIPGSTGGNSSSSWTASGANIYNNNTGNVGIGTTDPQFKLDVNGAMRVLGTSNSLHFTQTWMGYPDMGTTASEISNDVSNNKRLMIVGNKSGGADRRVGIWDRLDIAGAGFPQALNVNGGAYITGNLGIGQTTPAGKISFEDVSTTNSPVGITWNSNNGAADPTQYGIHKTAGSWSAPDYQQLRLGWLTGVVIDPGSVYSKSYVDIQGNGLRVTSGSLGIGTTDTKGYKLAVNGDAMFTKIKVKLFSTWPDYVFAPAYRLPSLAQVEAFIQQHNHLPDVPSAKEVEANGLDVGDNQALLLRKIEELTLYIIDQNKKIEQLEKAVQQIKAVPVK